MAKSFSNLKNLKSGMLDQLTFGKLKGCRICDVIPDNYEYLIWAEKQGYVTYQQEVVDVITEAANFAKWEAPVASEEVADKRQDLYGLVTRQDYYNTFEEDVPF